MVVYVKDQEATTAIDKRFLFFREVATDGEKHSGESLTLLGHVGVILLFQSGYAEEIAENSLSVENKRVVGKFLVGLFLIKIGRAHV